MDRPLADDHRWIRVAGPLAILFVGVLALVRSWSFGPDIQVDFGRELYLPWRISEGDHLYADVAHFSGPLSVYWHGLLFLLFGPGLSFVKASNAVVAAAITGFVYLLALRHSDSFAAILAALFFVGALAFAQLQPIGNYDYLTPYSHELTHGIALSLGALFWFSRPGADGSRGALICGALLGLVFFTKIEVFAALAAAFAVAVLLDLGSDDASGFPARRRAMLLASGFGIVVSGSVLALAAHVGSSTALAGVLQPLRAVLVTDVAGLPYYRWVMGTLDWSQSLASVGKGLLVYMTLALLLAGSAIAWRRWGVERFDRLLQALVLLTAFLIPFPQVWAVESIRPLLLVLGVLLFISARRFAKTRRRDDAAQIVLLVFAVVLPFKMLLNGQFGHYGFALYMPATLVGIVALVGYGPRWVEAHGGSAGLFRAGAAALVIVVALALNSRTQSQLERRVEPVGRGADALLSDFRADAVRQALDYLADTPAETTVAVLPEGIMLNYLARRVNPTPYVNFMPPEFSMYGEAEIVHAFRRDPPDVLLFVHKRAGLYGTPFFGRDYGRSLYGWAMANYRDVATYGQTPFEERTRFGISVLERKDRTAR